jgi:hypothetical protein
VGLPVNVEGAISTWWFRRMRFTLPVGSQVRMYATGPATAMFTGVPTAVPSFLNVVNRTVHW